LLCSAYSQTNLGAEGGEALAQALHLLPQLQTLDLSCALATARLERGERRAGGGSHPSRA
jgi:hypothetical protein